MEIIFGITLFAAGVVTGIFIYRNNVKTIDPIADRADEVADKIAAKLRER